MKKYVWDVKEQVAFLKSVDDIYENKFIQMRAKSLDGKQEFIIKALKSTCPVCVFPMIIEAPVHLYDLIQCDACHLDLEVESIKPLSLRPTCDGWGDVFW